MKIISVKTNPGQFLKIASYYPCFCQKSYKFTTTCFYRSMIGRQLVSQPTEVTQILENVIYF